MKRALISVFIVAFTMLFATGAYAGWVLYENFDSYANIDEMKASPKWNISEADEAIANFSIENGKLKIEHLAGYPNDSAWAQLIQNTGKIGGIRVTIEVQNWSGDARARIGADYGTLSDNPDLIWYSHELRHRWADWLGDYTEYVRGYLGVYDIPTFDWVFDLFYTELGHGKRPIVGVPYTLTAMFDWGIAHYQVDDPDDLGKARFKIIEEFDKIDEPFRGIGTRTGDDPGTCVVYFDDLYVYRTWQ